jgi:hypothetical protein
MKLEEWKKSLDTIPDNDYTRNLNYTQFEESKTVDAEDYDAMECYVLLNGKQISVQYANADRGFVIVIKGYDTNEIAFDKNGDVVTEFLFGKVKIIKYKS